jgi:Flp pilus assembly protein TadG
VEKSLFRPVGRRTRGSALIEITLLAPWIFFLFVFVIDMGFYNYSLIAIENAARVGAEYTSSSTSTVADQHGACIKILADLAMLPNLSGVTSCGAAPLTVTATSVTGADGSPATSVTITYQGMRMISIPGFMMGQLSFQRNVQMRVKA